MTAPAYRPLWPPYTTPGAPVVVVPPAPDLLAAVVARLRAYGAGAVSTAFQDSPIAPKFWADYAMASPNLPWLRLVEVDAPLEQEMVAADDVPHYYARGEIQASVFAPTKRGARSLRKLVRKALDDAPLPNEEGAVLVFRGLDEDFPPVLETTVRGPTAYHAIVRFSYILDVALPVPTPVSVATAPDLVAAVVALLRAADGGALATAFGDSSGTPKFWSDHVMASPDLPWLQIVERDSEEGQEMHGWGPTPAEQAPVDYPAGRLDLAVYAATKAEARTLRRAVVTALNDAPLLNDDCTVLAFRIASAVAPPVPETSVGVPKAYRAVASFGYITAHTI